MLIDDLLTSVPGMPMPQACFEVTSAYDALPEDGWQGWVSRLLDTTSCRPPFDSAWWEWRDTTERHAHIRHGIGLSLASYAHATAALRQLTDPRDHAHHDQEVAKIGGDHALIGTAFMSLGGRYSPVAFVLVALDDRYQAIRHGNGYEMLAAPLSPALRDRPDVLVNICWQSAYFVALLHVRNIGTQTHEPDAKLQRARIRRGKLPLVTYKTLHITPLGNRSPAGASTPHQGVQPLHLVRGNFAHYTEEAPLFGRFSGTYWRPAHVRGNVDNGTVVKDYALDAPKGRTA